MSRELDAEVAEKVMGYAITHDHVPPGDPFFAPFIDMARGVQAPHYSTSIATAFEVVEKMRERGCRTTMKEKAMVCGKRRWLVHIEGPNGWEQSVDDELPLAICQCALAAVKAQEGGR